MTVPGCCQVRSCIGVVCWFGVKTTVLYFLDGRLLCSDFRAGLRACFPGWGFVSEGWPLLLQWASDPGVCFRRAV